ncbi:ATP-binding protein [Kitasatospora sp. NBC_01266]|uniref:ATP-binding protein n=1 Tax=Kitasatospora sp. NBC_01266 TaxID=2903572 RepID=UPI002E32E5A3|nr:ATP-binding protein [Kitasatospora sp. NBC_01266]
MFATAQHRTPTMERSTLTMERPAPGVALGRRAACVMAAETGSVPALRRFARRVVRSWALPAGIDEAVALIVTELAANAVRHSGSPDVAVLISTDREAVTVEVKDRGQWCSASAAEKLGGITERVGGRGLTLVNAFSTGCVLWCGPDGTRAVAKVPLRSGTR